MNYLSLFGIEEKKSEGMCPVTAYYLITEYFDFTLFDILRTGKVSQYFFKEEELWAFLYNLLEILDFNRVRKIKR